MYITDFANMVYLDLNQPSDTSIPAIAQWARLNIGLLNNLINTDYSVNSTTLELADSSGTLLGESEAAIYKLLFYISYYTRQTRNSLGVGGVDLLLEATSDGGTLRFANRNEVAKTWNQIVKDTRDLLNKLVNFYKQNGYTPLSIDGDDVNVISTSSRYAPNSIDGSIFIDNGR